MRYVKIEIGEFEDLFTHLITDTMAINKLCLRAADGLEAQAQELRTMGRINQALADKFGVMLEYARAQIRDEEKDNANIPE